MPPHIAAYLSQLSLKEISALALVVLLYRGGRALFLAWVISSDERTRRLAQITKARRRWPARPGNMLGW